MAKKAVTPEVVVDKKAEKQRALNTAMAQIEREFGAFHGIYLAGHGAGYRRRAQGQNY